MKNRATFLQYFNQEKIKKTASDQNINDPVNFALQLWWYNLINDWNSIIHLSIHAKPYQELSQISQLYW